MFGTQNHALQRVLLIFTRETGGFTVQEVADFVTFFGGGGGVAKF